MQYFNIVRVLLSIILKWWASLGAGEGLLSAAARLFVSFLALFIIIIIYKSVTVGLYSDFGNILYFGGGEDSGSSSQPGSTKLSSENAPLPKPQGPFGSISHQEQAEDQHDRQEQAFINSYQNEQIESCLRIIHSPDSTQEERLNNLLRIRDIGLKDLEINRVSGFMETLKNQRNFKDLPPYYKKEFSEILRECAIRVASGK